MLETLETVWQDVRIAARTLKKSPGFTAVAVLTLAVAIAANASIFGLVNAVLLRALPYPAAERLVTVRDVQTHLDSAPASYPEFLDWRQESQLFELLAAFFPTDATLTGEGEPERLAAVRVTADLLPLLGVAPQRGRAFTAEDEPRTAPRVALISRALQERRFGGADVIGRTLTLDGESTTVVGVLAADAPRPPAVFGDQGRPDVWLPLRVDDEVAPRGMHFLTVLGRLRAGVNFDQAASEIEAVAGHLRADGRTVHGITLAPLRDWIVSDSRPLLLTLLGAVAFVLLIACANVANLLLARATVRQHEVAVRAALGASRSRLMRQLVTESLLLAAAGGALGIAGAWWGVHWLAGGAVPLPRADQLTLDGTVLAFTVGLTFLTSFLFGLAPAFHGSTVELGATFKEAGRQGGGTGAERQRMRRALVVAEIGLSVVLLVGAGLMIRSFRELLAVDLGFVPERVTTFNVSLPQARYPEEAQQTAFFDQALARLATLPGVAGAAAVSNLPASGGPNGDFEVEGVTWPEGGSPLVEKRRVTPGAFAVLGVPLLQGRTFTASDTADAPPVVIVNQTFAQRFLGAGNPIGRRVDFGWNTDGFQEVIGVVGDLKHNDLARPYEPAMYVPLAQNPQSAMEVIVRTATSTSLIDALRHQVWSIDKDLPLYRIQTLEESLAGALTEQRLAMGLLSTFAASALLLAMLGIYGVMSYSIEQRAQEMGIRMALGADRWQVRQMVLRQGLALALWGVAAGVAVALYLTRFLEASLYGVSATDPWTFAAVASLLIGVALLACYLPARRASQLDPLAALRHE